ncbi:Spo0E family sporulation regulatory protein-aspartic acid phosphatase [Cytobacillus pseudoceanisediminis]|uniref:Spo0E family sporulation regulatory protein-aspartic acid phosphatase n=1 Tax=Cytobacillus pseudoceanisediminis TaxID=3051614 RepID=UPI003C2AF3FC
MKITRLEIKINFKRNRMIRSGIKKGLNHPDTIRLSQQLDKLLNEYQKVKFYRSITIGSTNHIACL